jgi:amidase
MPADVVMLDATAQAELVRCRDVSARELTEAALRRIDEVEPRVNAFRVVMAEEALAEADRIDALAVASQIEAARPFPRWPLDLDGDQPARLW